MSDFYTCPYCNANLKTRGLRVVEMDADYWEEWFCTDVGKWYVESDDHGYSGTVTRECIACGKALPPEQSDELATDLDENAA